MKLRFSLLALAWLLPLSGTPTAMAAPQPVDRIVAVVNNEVITRYELAQRVEQFSSRLRQQGTQLPPREVFERQMLDRMIYERVQLQFARETSLRTDDATLERAVERVAANNRMQLPQFKQSLLKEGVQWEQFREEVRNEMTLGRLREREVESRVTVADAEIDSFLASNVLSSGQELRLAHILLRAPEGASTELWERLGKKAAVLLQRARSGEDFARLATENSEAPDALEGGNMGWRKPDRLPALYAEATRMLQPGGITPVLRSPAGLHIVKVLEMRGGEASEAAEVQKTRSRHILIKTSEVVSDAEARQRLQQIRERIVKGADFAEQAKRYSSDGSAPRGGELGWMRAGDLVPQFEQAMNALKIGEVSEPVQSPFGWHLIEVLERKTEDVSAERKRNQARAALQSRKSDEAYEEFVRELRDKAFVELRGDFAPTAAASEPAK